MAVGVTRDHHNLRRNLNLNGNYISNDGGDEGISISDLGLVSTGGNLAIGGTTITRTGALTLDASLDINLSADGGDIHFYDGATLFSTMNMVAGTQKWLNPGTVDAFVLTVGADGATSFTTNDVSNDDAGHLTLRPEGDTIIDRDTALIATGTAKGLHIDYDHTGISADGQTIDGIGLDLDMNCDSPTHVGTVRQIGIDIDMLAGLPGTQVNTGIDIKCTGGNDNNFGMNITVPDVAGDYHLKLMAADDVNDYATLHVADTGDMTIATVGSGTTDSDLTLDADGDIILDAAGLYIYFKNGVGGTTHGNIGLNTSSTLKLSSTTNYDLKLIAAGTGEMIFDGGDKIILDSATGGFEMHGAGVTAKFADMYAGMILGYTAINIDATQESYAVTGSLAVTDANHKVIFVAPPSGKVEIFVSFSAIAVTQRWLKLGLSNNATYAAIEFPNIGDPTNEHVVIDLPVDGFIRVIAHNWVVEGLTAGTEYTWYLGAQAEQAGRITMWWGGAATGRYAPFIMKATALPATITTE